MSFYLPRAYGKTYKRRYRAMLSLVQPLFGDAFVNGMALLSLGLVGYLLWLHFHERRKAQEQLRARERDRRKHWGYV